MRLRSPNFLRHSEVDTHLTNTAAGYGWNTRLTWRFWLIAITCTALVVGWRSSQEYSAGMQDLFQLYYGAKAWWLHGNAYNLAPVVPQDEHNLPQFQAGNAYPLPAILLTLPLSFLSAHMAGTIWIGLLILGLLIALRLVGSPFWLAMLLYFPLADGLRLEQYTIFVIIMQYLAFYAFRQGHHWTLAICCALAVTKPTQGLALAGALFVLTRDWRRFAIAGAAVWGPSLLLDPRWPLEWLGAINQYNGVAQQPLYYGLALFALPLLLIKDWVGAAVMAQFAFSPFPIGSAYAAGAVPLSVLDDPRSRWLPVLASPWLIVSHFLTGPGWATALLLVAPVTGLALWRWHERCRLNATEILRHASSAD